MFAEPDADDGPELVRLPETRENMLYYYSVAAKSLPMSLRFVDNEHRTIYERFLLSSDTPHYTDEQIQEEQEYLELLATLLCDGAASLKALHTCINYYNSKNKKPEISFEEVEYCIKMRSHFFRIYDKQNVAMVENTLYGLRRYFPSVVCLIASFPNGINLRGIKRSLAGLPIAGDTTSYEIKHGEYFWKRYPDIVEMLNFFKSHPAIFAVSELEKAKLTDKDDYIIRLTPTARLIPSLWNSEIFLRMVLPDEDKSLTSTLQGKVVASLSNSGVALAHDLVISKVYFGSNSVETDIKTELPPLTPVVIQAYRVYDKHVHYIATQVTKAPGRKDEIKVVAAGDAVDYVEDPEAEMAECRKLKLADRQLRKRIRNLQPRTAPSALLEKEE